MAGVRLGVSYSAVSAVGEADALINIEAEHAPGRCDNFPAGFASESNLKFFSAAASAAGGRDGLECAQFCPTGQCWLTQLLVLIYQLIQLGALVGAGAIARLSWADSAAGKADALKFPSAPAFAGAAEPLGRYSNFLV